MERKYKCLIGATAQSPIDGHAHTTAIIGQSGGGSTTDRAATVFDAYTNTQTGTGVNSDWYLHAVWELNQCYNAAFVVNTILGATNGFQLSYYWSSSENVSYVAWANNFSNGTAYGSNGKSTQYWVCAVRAF